MKKVYLEPAMRHKFFCPDRNFMASPAAIGGSTGEDLGYDDEQNPW